LFQIKNTMSKTLKQLIVGIPITCILLYLTIKLIKPIYVIPIDLLSIKYWLVALVCGTISNYITKLIFRNDK